VVSAVAAILAEECQVAEVQPAVGNLK